MSEPILQDRLPFLPWMDNRTNRLPGILPVEGDDWLRRDDAYGAQMRRRDALILGEEARVHALLPEAEAAAAELYDLILARLRRDTGYHFEGDQVIRPDGVRVDLDRARPLVTLGRLVQEDLCILDTTPETHAEGGHQLTGAVLCFPASWTLSQKIGRSMLRIHVPVNEYDERVARGVQRLFDAIRPEQPLWRMNFLTYDDPELFQPRIEGELRPRPERHDFIRCERQCLIRLPQSHAVVFAIHTYQVCSSTLSDAERAALMERLHTV